MFVAQKRKKNVDSTKCQSSVKKNYKKNHQMKNLLLKCIEFFLTYIFLILKILNDMIILNFILESPFHIEKFNLLHGFFYQSHV
jgi:uncharacterized membrane protein